MYMAVRDEPQTSEALEELKRDGFHDIRVLELDLVNPRFAKQAAERFMEIETRLDVLGVFFVIESLMFLRLFRFVVNNAALYFASFFPYLG